MAVSSTVIAVAAPVTSTAAVSATALIAGRVPSGVSSMTGFCNSERTLKMGQDGVVEVEMKDHRAANGEH